MLDPIGLSSRTLELVSLSENHIWTTPGAVCGPIGYEQPAASPSVRPSVRGDHSTSAPTVPGMTIRIGHGPVAPQPPQPEVPKGRTRRWPLYAAVAAAGLVLIGGGVAAGIVIAGRGSGGSGAPAVSTTAPAAGTIRGVITLHAGQFAWDRQAASCWGKGGYDDLTKGASVTVTDAAGKTIALGSVVSEYTSFSTDEFASSCTLNFQVENVPRGGQFYGVEVSHRGVVHESEADAFSGQIQLTIG